MSRAQVRIGGTLAALSMTAGAALGGAAATSSWGTNAAAGTATTPGGTVSFADAAFLVGVGQTVTSTGSPPPSIATAAAFANLLRSTVSTAASGHATADDPPPFANVVPPTMSAASANAEIWGEVTGNVLTIHASATWTLDGYVELAVLNLTGWTDQSYLALVRDERSVEHALAHGLLSSQQVLGYWRETSQIGTMGFTTVIDITGIDPASIAVHAAAHASSVPAPGASVLGLAGLGWIAGRRRR